MTSRTFASKESREKGLPMYGSPEFSKPRPEITRDVPRRRTACPSACSSNERHRFEWSVGEPIVQLAAAGPRGAPW